MSILTEYDEEKTLRVIAEQAREEGREEGVEQMIESMLRRGKTIEEIADFCAYPRELIEEIRDRMMVMV